MRTLPDLHLLEENEDYWPDASSARCTFDVSRQKVMTFENADRKIGDTRFCRLATGMLLALAVGAIAGWGRYWYGYFVLGQGVIVGLFIPWALNISCSGALRSRNMTNSPGPMMHVLILFFCFMIAQAIGFGMAQPWFDPLGWLSRVVQDETREAVWGVSLLGGVAARDFQLGVSGGFWIFLNLFDLFFMGFFLLVGINSQPDDRQ